MKLNAIALKTDYKLLVVVVVTGLFLSVWCAKQRESS